MRASARPHGYSGQPRLSLGEVLSGHLVGFSQRETCPALSLDCRPLRRYHGSAFSNVVFSKPGTFAVEIFTRPCRTKNFGFTVARLGNTTGVHFRTLYLGLPFRNAWAEDTRSTLGAVCKPRYVALDAEQDLPELSACINEELYRL